MLNSPRLDTTYVRTKTACCFKRPPPLSGVSPSSTQKLRYFGYVSAGHRVKRIDGLLKIRRLLRCGTSLCQLTQCAPKASAGNLGLAVKVRKKPLRALNCLAQGRAYLDRGSCSRCRSDELETRRVCLVPTQRRDQLVP